MKIIKKEVDYALRALIFIHEKGGHASAKEIYSDIKAPRPFLRKILQILAKEKILKSEKGKGGGFYFNVKFENINLKMLSLPFTEKMKKGACPFQNRLCKEYSRCHLRSKIYDIESELFNILEKNYIKDLWAKS